MKNLTISLIWLLLLPALTVWFVGCSQTIYDRITINPDGTIEQVHIGSTSLATAKAIDGLVIETGRGRVALNQATADNDKLKVVTPYGIIETEK
jgi:archaeosine-15-forming tRNA-guanine transglycosylase